MVMVIDSVFFIAIIAARYHHRVDINEFKQITVQLECQTDTDEVDALLSF